jgi:lysyl-tRNA synthetase class 1
MFWGDEIAAEANGPQIVNDSKTPSGTIHVGALRGVVIHDVLTRALRDRGLPARFLYGIDDLDPMDSATLATREGVGEYMGRPLAEVPAPRGSASSPSCTGPASSTAPESLTSSSPRRSTTPPTCCASTAR